MAKALTASKLRRAMIATLWENEITPMYPNSLKRSDERGRRAYLEIEAPHGGPLIAFRVEVSRTRLLKPGKRAF